MFAAENRKESRGAHARDDFPDRDDANWMHHTMTYQERPEDKPVIKARAVIADTLDDEVETIAPFARVY